ncbi:MAG: hypothetical protein O3B01_32495, partial [Planctomycetota bacterium]|nr:hypothetical protein [Planctomycetota bacterium]
SRERHPGIDCKSRFNPGGVAQQEIVEPWATLLNVFDVKKKAGRKLPLQGLLKCQYSISTLT